MTECLNLGPIISIHLPWDIRIFVGSFFVCFIIRVFPIETFYDLQEHFCFTSRISTQSVLAECLILGPVISKFFISIYFLGGVYV